jgi:hypothetical protein
MALSLLVVNSMVSIKSLFAVFNHTLQGSVFTLIFTHLLPLTDARTNTEGEGVWRRDKGGLFSDTQERTITHLIR